MKVKHSLLNLRQLFFMRHRCSGAPLIGNAVIYKREIEELKKTVFEKATQIQSDEDIWELHNFLTERRDEIDEKYDCCLWNSFKRKIHF